MYDFLGLYASCRGTWHRYKWSRFGIQAGSYSGEGQGPLPSMRGLPVWTCICWWLCEDCEYPSAMSVGGIGLPTTPGIIFYDGGISNVRSGNYTSGNNCLCSAPGPETGCDKCYKKE